MIRTKYDISLEIDDKPFSIVVNEATKQQKEELTSVFDKNKGQYEKRDFTQARLNEFENEFDINKQILKDDYSLDLAKKQKKLNKLIFKLKDELKEFNSVLVSISKMMEDVFEKRFDFLVSGTDKVALKQEIVDKGIGYQVLFDAIAELVTKEKEKK